MSSYDRHGFGASIALALCLWGCAAPPVTLPGGFVAPSASSAPGKEIETLEVVTAADARPFQGRSRLGPAFLTFIPLVPYGHQQISPELPAFSAAMKNDSFVADVTDVVIEDLRAARVARWIGAPDDRLPGRGATAPGYQLHLTVEQGIYHRNTTLYGLSIAGFFLWVVGLPVSYGSAELIVGVDLRDANGVSLGSEEFRGEESVVEWMYSGIAPSYTPAMPKAYARISPRLRAFVIERLPGS